MLTFTISFNILLVFINLYIAWRIRKLSLTLAQITETLKNVERIVYSVLHGAPPALLGTQQGTHNLRQSYAQLELQIQHLQKIITLLNLVTNFWRWSYPNSFPRKVARKL